MPQGRGVASSSWKSHDPRAAKPSMSSRTSARTWGSSFSISRGTNCGLSRRRYCGVLGRVDFERDLRLLAEVQVHVGGREVLRVAHRPEDVLVPVEEDLAPRLPVAPGDRALLAQPAVDGVRVVGGGAGEQRACRIGGVGHAGTGRARLARSKPKTFAAFPETIAWRSSSDTPAN